MSNHLYQSSYINISYKDLYLYIGYIGYEKIFKMTALKKHLLNFSKKTLSKDTKHDLITVMAFFKILYNNKNGYKIKHNYMSETIPKNEKEIPFKCYCASSES